MGIADATRKIISMNTAPEAISVAFLVIFPISRRELRCRIKTATLQRAMSIRLTLLISDITFTYSTQGMRLIKVRKNIRYNTLEK